jgi:dihydropteroate synthase
VPSELSHDFSGGVQTNADQDQRVWRAGSFSFDVSAQAQTVVMGIVNVTPDSFSDGGLYFDPNHALKHAEQLIYDGAQILDVGGESTRPGAPAVDAATEMARVIPLIKALAAQGHCVSIDTRKATVMRAAIDAGASVVNDISALAAEGALELCANGGVGVVLMHMQGEPGTMQREPHYDDVLRDVSTFLRLRIDACIHAGIASDRIAIDPGFGFGKTMAHNIALTQQLDQLVAVGYPVVAGWSRKSTLGALTGRSVASERVSASVAAALACVARGARMVRVHDVRETVDALKVWRALG